MERHEEVFLSLLRNASWGSPVEIPDGFADWGKVVRLAKNQSVLGTVGDVMLSDPSISAVLPLDLKTRIKTFVMMQRSFTKSGSATSPTARTG